MLENWNTKMPSNSQIGKQKAAGQQNWSSTRIPILSLARKLPQTPIRGLDEREKAGLLTSRSFYSPRLTTRLRSGFKGFLSLVTAALPHGIYTRFPILLWPRPEALFRVTTTTCGGFFQRTTLLVGFIGIWVNQNIVKIKLVKNEIIPQEIQT